MTKPATKLCAVYTRKSSEEGLDQSFNSLQAQREACEAFIKSQVGEGWSLVSTHYDDGGISGGTMDRPSLKKLLADIEAGKVDVVVVYKVDRLTRSLADFAKMVELFDKHSVSFVAVTQQFNTTTSMGRLTLNVLLSFAQFEREVTGERIRDKIAASKRKGMWMGGCVPLGYDVVNRTLMINPTEAKLVERIYRSYLTHKNIRLVKRELDAAGVRSKQRAHKNGVRGGGPMFPGAIYGLLRNPVYIGKIKHRDVTHQGMHESIIDQAMWDAVQKQLTDNQARPRGPARVTDPSPLLGKVFDESGKALTPAHTSKGTKRRRYYISRSLRTGIGDRESAWRLSAITLEEVVAKLAIQALSNRKLVLAEVKRVEGISPMDAFAAANASEEALRNQTSNALATLVQRVDLSTQKLSLRMALGVGKSVVVIRHSSAMTLKRRGVETRLVLEGPAIAPSKADPVLVRGLARGHQWLEDLLIGREKSMVNIARRDKVTDRYVSRHIRLALLSPEVTQSILAGNHSPTLTLQSLITGDDYPLEWQRQKEILT